jgi:hypothetical protein
VKKGKRDSYTQPFVMLGKRLWLKSPEWRGLSPQARDVYAMLKSKYNGHNNGEIRLHYSEIRGVSGLKCNKSISKAFRELEAKTWIERTKIGGMYRYHNLYKLTGKFDEHL